MPGAGRDEAERLGAEIGDALPDARIGTAAWGPGGDAESVIRTALAALVLPPVPTG